LAVGVQKLAISRLDVEDATYAPRKVMATVVKSGGGGRKWPGIAVSMENFDLIGRKKTQMTSGTRIGKTYGD